MASRLEKYGVDLDTSSVQSTRSSRNARLYKEVYGKYGNLDNLPIEDNTNEIDMESLKELVLNSNRKSNVKNYSNYVEMEKTSKKSNENRIYDINEMLERAKYENSKLKEPVSYTSKIDKNILSTLENDDVSLEDIKKETNTLIKKNSYKDKEDELSMTRELKFKNLTRENDMATRDLSLDMLSDLKPTGNTIVTKPVVESDLAVDNVKKNDNSGFIKPLTDMSGITKEDFFSSDTSDIDVIKEVPKNNIDKDFFTSSYEFSKKDFTSDDDFDDDDEKGSGLLKIILLFLFVVVLIGVIIYFILNYGIGA